MLLLEPIRDANHPYLPAIKALYEIAFPAYERRIWEKFLALLAEPKMFVKAVISDEQLIGVVVYWQLEEWLYVEHFAVVPALRGRQFGSKVIQSLLDQVNSKLILETELPITEDACRRVRFYERLGLKTIEHPYNQPPYRKEENPIPMRLMATSTVDEKQYDLAVELIKYEVYERFY